MRIGAGLIALAAAALIARPACAQVALEPGLWKLTVNSITNGKPDPVQNSEECLGDELKDLPAYFAPQLEGVKAECTRTRQPSDDGKLAYLMKCSGAGFTVEALTSVTFVNSRHFSASMQINSRSRTQSARVEASAQGHHAGACPAR
jgi:hypothetical protein